MSIAAEIFDVLSPIVGEDCVYDTKLPDGFHLSSRAVLVFQNIDDTPNTYTIQGTIPLRDHRWQVSVRSLDLSEARALKTTVIGALHGYRATFIRWCAFESAPGEIYEEDSVPPQYHIPIDFLIVTN